MPNKPKQKFSFLFHSNIWKVLPDFHLPLLAIELRDHEKREIKVSVIDCALGKELPSNDLQINWWSGLAAINEGCFLIQNFKDPKFPEANGFILYDSINRRTVIEDKESAFAFFSGNLLVCTKTLFDRIIYQSWNVAIGLKEELTVDSLKKLTPNPLNISLPSQYKEGSTHFSTVNRFIKNVNDKDAVSALEYLETDSLIIVSYYIRGLKKLQNFLLLTDLEGDLIEDIILDSELEGISKETFFVKNNHLYFVKNKKELVSYEL